MQMVSVRREWWDDEVFEAYPTWDDALDDECNYFGVRMVKNNHLKLREYFGVDGDIGARNYARCVKYGIGHEILSKMLPSETNSDIKQALTSLPLTARAKRGLELQAEEERVKAEAKRQEAARIAAEQARIEREAQ